MPKGTNETTLLVKQFIAGELSFDELQTKLGKSRPTIYRYAKTVVAGKNIFDKRTLGNNRKYAK